MIHLEHVTAAALRRSGIELEEVAAVIETIRRNRKWLRVRSHVRRLELAIGGGLHIIHCGEDVPTSDLHFGVGFVMPENDDYLIYASIPLSDHLTWEADFLCDLNDVLPISLQQGVDGLPLGSVVEHGDLPGGIIVHRKDNAPTRAIISIGEIACEPLPAPRRRDRWRLNRRQAGFLRDERLKAIPTHVQRHVLRICALGFGSIPVFLMAAVLRKSGTLVHNGVVPEATLVIAFLVPLRSAWNVLNGNPLLHRMLSLPFIEDRHRSETGAEQVRRVGARPRITWFPTSGAMQKSRQDPD